MSCILGGQCTDGYGCTEDDGVPYIYPNCPNADQCLKTYEWLNSPEKAEYDRRDAENNARIREALDRGEVPDPPF